MKNQSGFNIIEVTVALFISLLMLGSVIDLYVTNKWLYNKQEQYAGMKRNMRFAFDFLSEELRTVRFSSCVPWHRIVFHPSVSNDSIREGIIRSKGLMGANAVQGYNPVLTIDNSGTTVQVDGYTPQPNYYSNASASHPDNIYFMTIVSGPYYLAKSAKSGKSQVVLIDASGFASISSSSERFAYLVSCHDSKAEMFKIQPKVSKDKVLLKNGDSLLYDYDISESPLLYEVGFVQYGIFINRGRVSLGRKLIGSSEIEELVSYVENIQFTYGLDTDGDDTADYYVNADNVVASGMDWTGVISIRVTMVAQSPEGDRSFEAIKILPGTVYERFETEYFLPIYLSDSGSLPNYYGPLRHNNDLSGLQVPRLRQVLTSTVQLRNNK